jgi:hypothetical protein
MWEQHKADEIRDDIEAISIRLGDDSSSIRLTRQITATAAEEKKMMWKARPD